MKIASIGESEFVMTENGSVAMEPRTRRPGGGLPQ
jgi:hypothetical protein